MASFTAVGKQFFCSLSVANVDGKYGPYSSVQAAFDKLGEDNDDVLAVGLTVGITQSDGSIKEYWVKKKNGVGFTVNDFVEKLVGGNVDAITINGKTITPTAGTKNIPLPIAGNSVTYSLHRVSSAKTQQEINDLSDNDEGIVFDTAVDNGDIVVLANKATNTTWGVVKTSIQYVSTGDVTILGVSMPVAEAYKAPTWISGSGQVETLIPQATEKRPGLISAAVFKKFNDAANAVVNGSDFVATKQYYRGDVVKYADQLYEFKVDHKGNWAEADVTLLSELTNVVEKAKAAVDEKLLDFEKELYYVIHGIAYTGQLWGL